MSIPRLVTWITFLAIFAMAAKVSIDSDTWWHLRAGEWIVENRAIPQTDPFSYTRLGQPWQYPGWLAEVPMYLIHRLLGPGGLNLMTAALVTLAFWFVSRTLTGGAFSRAFLLVLAAAASGVYWAARPYLITFLLTAVYLYVLEKYRWEPSAASEKRLWLLPLLMVIWANSHGGFATGFILLGVYGVNALVKWLLDRFRRSSAEPDRLAADRRTFWRLFVVGLACLAAVCLNPSGPVMLLYPFKTVSIGVLGEFIQEWQSPDLQLPASQPFIGLILLLLAALGLSRRRLALTDFLLLAGFLYLAFLAWRNVALFALAAPPVIARHLDPVVAALSRRFGYRSAAPTHTQARLNAILLAVMLLAAAVKALADFPLDRNLAVIRQTMPVEAVTFLKTQELPGQLFNSYNWGGYLLWELPEYPVFVDGRTDLYNDELIGEWLGIVRAEPGWQAALERWQVRLVLVEPAQPLAVQLPQEGWREVYRDEVAVIFAR